jgi:hypothetical protein
MRKQSEPYIDIVVAELLTRMIVVMLLGINYYRPSSFKCKFVAQFYRCDRGGTGRRARLRGVWETVWVQVPSVAPFLKYNQYENIGCFFMYAPSMAHAKKGLSRIYPVIIL